MGEVSDTISDVVAKMATAMAIMILNVFIKVGCIWAVCLSQIKLKINDFANIARYK